VASKIDARLLQQLQQLKESNQNLQGQVKVLREQSNNQGGSGHGFKAGMKRTFGGLHNPKIPASKISPLPRNCRGKSLF